MSYTYRSSNPVEAGFVEAFFREKGLTCKLTPTSGVYGMPGFEVVVAEDVSPELEAELHARLNSTAPGSEAETASEPPPGPPFSLFSVFVIFILSQFALFSSYRLLRIFSDRFLGGVLTTEGINFLSYAAMAAFVYWIVRVRLRTHAPEYLAFNGFSRRSFLIWMPVCLAWTGFRIFMTLNNGGSFHYVPPSPLSVLVFICGEVVYRGFLFRGIKDSRGPVVALLLSSALFAFCMYYRYPFQKQLYTFGTGLILGGARWQGRSTLLPIIIAIAGFIFLLTYSALPH